MEMRQTVLGNRGLSRRKVGEDLFDGAVFRAQREILGAAPAMLRLAEVLLALAVRVGTNGWDFLR
jgi:hypothetical protein